MMRNIRVVSLIGRHGQRDRLTRGVSASRRRSGIRNLLRNSASNGRDWSAVEPEDAACIVRSCLLANGYHRKAWSAFARALSNGVHMTKTDIQLKQDIEEELRWDPKVNAAQIGVTVDGGAVSLLGAVDSYPEKRAAEDATKRVSGVRTVAHDLTVKVLGEHKRSDSEIAAAVQSALKDDVWVPKAVTAKVQHGWVTLEGQVTWNYHREASERAVRHLAGVVGVVNGIMLKPQTQVSAAQVKEKVEAALQRQATADAKSIHIDTSGGKVTLTGHASSWQSIEDAANTAWATPGVTEVVDRLEVQRTH
jgi:osmotically-inducible protein OsmY